MDPAPAAEIATPPAPGIDTAPVGGGDTPASGIADGVLRPLDPHYVDLERQIGWIAASVLTLFAIGGVGIFLIAGRPRLASIALVTGVTMAGLAAFTWWQQVWPALEYRRASFRVDANGLEIRRGIFFRAVTNVPRSRVQHTDVSQGPLQRRFGLATLIVHTAGNESAVVELPGLTYETALLIRDHLLPGRTEDAV